MMNTQRKKTHKSDGESVPPWIVENHALHWALYLLGKIPHHPTLPCSEPTFANEKVWVKGQPIPLLTLTKNFDGGVVIVGNGLWIALDSKSKFRSHAQNPVAWSP